MGLRDDGSFDASDAVAKAVDRSSYQSKDARSPIPVDQLRGIRGVPQSQNPGAGAGRGITKRGDGSSTMGEELTAPGRLQALPANPRIKPNDFSNARGPSPIEDKARGEAIDDPDAAAQFAKGGNPRSYSQQIKDNLAKTAGPRTANTTPIPTTPPGQLQTAKYLQGPQQMAKRGDGSYGPSDVDTYGSNYSYDYPSSLEGKPSVNNLGSMQAGGQPPASPSGWAGDDVDGSDGQGSTQPGRGGPGYPAATDRGDEYPSWDNLKAAQPTYAPSPSVDPSDSIKMAAGDASDTSSNLLEGLTLGQSIGKGVGDQSSKSGGQGGVSGKSGAGVTNNATNAGDDIQGMDALQMAKGDQQPSKTANVSPAKAKKILKDGQVNGKPLTSKQRKMFGVIAGGK